MRGIDGHTALYWHNTTAPPEVLLGNLVDTECLAFSFFVFVLLLLGKVDVAKFWSEKISFTFLSHLYGIYPHTKVD